MISFHIEVSGLGVSALIWVGGWETHLSENPAVKWTKSVDN